jgi:uroporphyrinogen-III synthase
MIERRPLVWVTRAAPGAERTAEALGVLGIDAIAAPVITLAATRRPPPERTKEAGAALFTSPNAVEFALSAGISSLIGPGTRAWCVGESTAEAARLAGFEIAHIGEGNAADLSRDMARSPEAPASLLHPANAAGDAFEAPFGTVYLRWDVYAPQNVGTLDDEVAAALGADTLDGFVIHSARGATATAELIGSHDVSTLSLFAMSQAAAAPLVSRGFARCLTPDRPSELRLLDLISKRLKRNPDEK